MSASQILAEEPLSIIAARREQIRVETIPPKPLTIARRFLLAGRIVVGVSFGLIGDGGWSEPLRLEQTRLTQERMLDRIKNGEVLVTLDAVRFLSQPNSYIPDNNGTYARRVVDARYKLLDRAHTGEITLPDNVKFKLTLGNMVICGVGGSVSSHASGGCHACIFEEASTDLLKRKKWERLLERIIKKTPNRLARWTATIAKGRSLQLI